MNYFKTTIILLFAIAISMNDITAQKSKLIYVGDPMCSWCYGIANELSQTIDHFGDDFDLEIVMGGLRAGGGEEWNARFKEFLKHHWEDVGMRSGQPFKFDLLDLDYFNYDTEPACRSIATVLSIDESSALAFFKEVQKGFYLENRDPKVSEFYQPICQKFDIDYKVFKGKFEGNEMKIATQRQFKRSQELGARSFPTLLLEHKGQVYLVASGYSTFEKMKARILQITK